MSDQPEFCVILTTVESLEEADRLAALLVKEQLAACVQVFPITSHYIWQDNLHKESENLLMLKTRPVLYQQVEAFLCKEHSYDVPEVIMLPVNNGLKSYFSWIRDHTQHPS